MIISLSAFGANITNDIIGNLIYESIKKNIDNELIEIDFTGVRVMTTFCAKQIFGRLLSELGSGVFFQKFSFVNADDNIQYIISIGINNEKD